MSFLRFGHTRYRRTLWVVVVLTSVTVIAAGLAPAAASAASAWRRVTASYLPQMIASLGAR
jgi:hypothetical protein